MKSIFKKISRGFTLIELLVVIAIIGILAAIVLASLGAARGKARDASIEGAMSSMRAAMELYANANNYKYQTGVSLITACTTANTGFVDTASNMQALVNSVTSQALAYDCGIAANGLTWSVAAQLTTQNNGANVYWCVDSTGASRSTQSGTQTAYTALNGSGAAAHTGAINTGTSVCN